MIFYKDISILLSIFFLKENINFVNKKYFKKKIVVDLKVKE